MRNLKYILLLTLTIAFAVLFAACGKKSEQPAQIQQSWEEEKPVTLTISTAASLKDAMEELRTVYLKEKKNVTLTYNFGSSGSLQKQIEQGAEVDVFISAAVKQMNALKDKGLIIEDTRKDFLQNKLVLVVPKGTSNVSDFKDLSTEKVKIVGLGEVKSVPAGQYAQEALTKLNILDSVKAKAVYGKDVKEVLTWVETGNLDAGVVYETDAKGSDKVKIAATAPEESHKPILYPAAVMKTSQNVNAAKDFITFLYSSKAKTVFEKYGFLFTIE